MSADDSNERVQRRYDRVAPFYDTLESIMELRAAQWRRDLWTEVTDGDVLEVGVGTGKNLRFHPTLARVTAIDLAPKMLERADVQALRYRDGSFDVAVATFVFCSVPDPVLGLRELRRVLRPGGRLLLLEHVLSERRWLRRIMCGLDPITARVVEAHIARETIASVREAGFTIREEKDLALDVVKRIDAVAPSASGTSCVVASPAVGTSREATSSARRSSGAATSSTSA